MFEKRKNVYLKNASKMNFDDTLHFFLQNDQDIKVEFTVP